MSKLLRFCVLSVLISGLSFAGILNVTSPAAGSEWCINDSNDKLEIRWHETPHDHQAVKIRLFDSSGNIRIMSIVDNTINDGSFNWLIPASVQPGQYTILVKTTDNQEFDFSAPITIKSCSQTEPIVPVGRLEAEIYFPPKPDLQISIFFHGEPPNINEETLIEFRVKNIGQGTSSPTKMRAFMGGSGTPTDTWDVKALGPGRFMYKTKRLKPAGVGWILWTANVDQAGDANQENNRVSKKMIVKGSDLIVCISNARRPPVGGSRTITAVVKNIGEVKSLPCKLRIYVKQKGVTYHNIPALNPGGPGFKVERKHSWGLAGSKKIEAIIDYYHIVPESNEKNNIVTGSYFVRLPHHDRYAVGDRIICSDGTTPDQF